MLRPTSAIELSAVLLERPIGVLLIREEQFGQMLTAQHIEDERGEDQRGDDSGHVKDATEALPSSSLGIEKYLSIEHFVYAIQYESYGS